MVSLIWHAMGIWGIFFLVKGWDVSMDLAVGE